MVKKKKTLELRSAKHCLHCGAKLKGYPPDVLRNYCNMCFIEHVIVFLRSFGKKTPDYRRGKPVRVSDEFAGHLNFIRLWLERRLERRITLPAMGYIWNQFFHGRYIKHAKYCVHCHTNLKESEFPLNYCTVCIAKSRGYSTKDVNIKTVGFLRG